MLAQRTVTRLPWFTAAEQHLTRTLKQMGKQSEFIAGLRITDAETRDAALMVLGGRVNKELVAALGGHGQAGVGLYRVATG